MGNSMFYSIGEQVVKKIEQVGRSANNTDLILGGDSKIFDKVTQAINSSYDLICKTIKDEKKTFFAFICPILVIPDGRLWIAEYSGKGELIGQPKRTDNFSKFIGQS